MEQAIRLGGTGFISLVLGIMIWRQWALFGSVGNRLFVGIEMLLNGWSLVMLSLTARNLPEETLAARAPCARSQRDPA